MENRVEKMLRLRQKARELKASGMTHAQIGRLPQFNMDPSVVSKIMTEKPPAGSGPCQKCGKQTKSLHRHHTDYKKDEVVHVCASCHKKMHWEDPAFAERVKERSAKSRLDKWIKKGPLVVDSKPVACHCCGGSGEEEDRTSFGRALSGIRLRADMGLREMARKLGISHTYLWQLENGKRNWTPELERNYRELL